MPPFDDEAERAALGSMLIDIRAARIVADALTLEDFYKDRNRAVFSVLREMLAFTGDLDEISVCGELHQRGLLEKTGGKENIGRLIMDTPSAASCERYCKTVLDRARERRAIQAAGRILQAATGNGDVEAEARAAVEAVALRSERGCPEDLMDAEIEAEIEGTRAAIDFPKCPCLSQTLALMPGGFTMLCGDAGASKSLFMVEHLWRWWLNGIPVSSMQLEKGVPFHLRRLQAQMAEAGWLTNSKKVKQWPEEARSIKARLAMHMQRAREAGVIQAPPEGTRATAEYLLNWMSREVERGIRIIVVDPITYMGGGEKRYLDQERFVDGVRNIIDRNPVSVVCVTHPKDGRPGEKVVPMKENIKGSKSFQQFTDTILWLEAHDDASDGFLRVDRDGDPLQPHEMKNRQYNRTLHILKKRLAGTYDTRIAYEMDPKTLWHNEIGWIP